MADECPCVPALRTVLGSPDCAEVIGLIRRHRFGVGDLQRAAVVPDMAVQLGEYVPLAAAVAASKGDLAALQFFFGAAGAPLSAAPAVLAAYPADAAPPAAFVLPPYSAEAYNNSCLYHAARNGRLACAEYLLAADGARLTPDDAAAVRRRLAADPAVAVRPEIAHLLATGGVPLPVCYVDSDGECVCDAPHSP